MAKNTDMDAFVSTLEKKKPERSGGAPIKVEMPDPIKKWRHLPKYDGEGRLVEVISEAIE